MYKYNEKRHLMEKLDFDSHRNFAEQEIYPSYESEAKSKNIKELLLILIAVLVVASAFSIILTSLYE